MINLAFFLTMLWTWLNKEGSDCFYRSQGEHCYVDDPMSKGVNGAINYATRLSIVNQVSFAFTWSMFSNLVSFILHFTDQQMQIHSNDDDN